MPLVYPINRYSGSEGRLTLASGTPITTSDQTAKTTVYFTPFVGSRVALYNGTSWEIFIFSEVSVAVPSTLFRLFDVFVYNNAGTITLETVNWDQSSAAITAATAAAECQITSNGHGLANADLVGIAGVVGTLGTDVENGINGKVWAVRNSAANTFTLDGSDTTGLTYTSGGTWYKVPNTRTTDIVRQDGVFVKSGSTNKRYLGTLMTTGVSGETEDSVTKRFVWNYYNRAIRTFYKIETAASWIYSTSTLRAMNNNTDIRIAMVVGAAESFFTGAIAGKFETTVNANGTVLLADNNIDNSITTPLPTHAVANANTFEGWVVNYVYALSTGYHFLQAVEQGFGSGTQTFYGESSSGIFGSILG